MTDKEIKEAMLERHFTEHGADLYLEVRNHYPRLYCYYDEYNGNFGMTETELIHEIEEVKMFLRNHEDYCLIYQNNEIEEEPQKEVVWWLTDNF